MPSKNATVAPGWTKYAQQNAKDVKGVVVLEVAAAAEEGVAEVVLMTTVAVGVVTADGVQEAGCVHRPIFLARHSHTQA